MDRLKTTAAISAVTASLLLAACASDTEAPAASAPQRPGASAAASAAPSSAVAKGRAEVLRDLLFATRNLDEEPHIVKRSEERLEACSIDGSGVSPTVLGRRELLAAVDRLQQRGWAFGGSGAVEASNEGVQAHVTSGDWLVFIGVGPAPADASGREGANASAFAFSAQSTCSAS
ncbi:hypothetical protein [Streptomyces sp. DH12]|uniref:hypothetical protein n=1 Tax=Streptomyces sp. DH12 TaxID=2857010 RepID=UPI001E531E71|nr:hypothetical protein [Streptomyces sp. DH12]